MRERGNPQGMISRAVLPLLLVFGCRAPAERSFAVLGPTAQRSAVYYEGATLADPSYLDAALARTKAELLPRTSSLPKITPYCAHHLAPGHNLMVTYREVSGAPDREPGGGELLQVTLQIPASRGLLGTHTIGQDGVLAIHTSGSRHDPHIARFGYVTSGTIQVAEDPGGLRFQAALGIELPAAQQWFRSRLRSPEQSLELDFVATNRPLHGAAPCPH